MISRSLMSAAVLGTFALAPLPVLAKSDTAQIAKQMRDPQTQVAVAAAVRAMSDAMLDLRIAPLLDAVETARDPLRDRSRYDRVDPDTRLRDYAGRDAEELPEKLSRRLPAMMGVMGGMAEAVEEMKPALKDVARQMGAAVGASMTGARGAADAPGDYEDDDIPSAIDE